VATVARVVDLLQGVAEVVLELDMVILVQRNKDIQVVVDQVGMVAEVVVLVRQVHPPVEV
jgi:hypothetical protein